ncbi:hypothetical protein PDN39_27540 [Bacillus cereus]|nr:hypothetical protein [Bacillus cereus]
MTRNYNVKFFNNGSKIFENDYTSDHAAELVRCTQILIPHPDGERLYRLIETILKSDGLPPFDPNAIEINVVPIFSD